MDSQRRQIRHAPWRQLKPNDDGSYTVTAPVETKDDLPRGFFLGLRNVIAVWIATVAFLWIVYTLTTLPGLP
jgi:hypothetical protein